MDDELLDPIEDASELTFVLNGVEFRGQTVYDAEDLAEHIEDFVGDEVTLGSLREIGNRVERRYRSDGYVATRVIIPPQAIREGRPVLQIFEGKIIHYEINGEIGDVKKQIARLLDNLLTDEPATWAELERYLLLARDLPGISLTGTLRSAGDSSPGGVIMVVDAARKPVDAFLNVQNRNAHPTGPWTGTLGVSMNSNTKYAERFGFVLLVAAEPQEQASGYFVYEQSLGNEGLRFRASLTQGFSEPGDELDTLGMTSVTTLARAELEFPVVRGRRFSFWTKGGFEFAMQRVTARKIELFDDELRTFFLAADGVWFAPLGATIEFGLEFRKGVDDFGAPVPHQSNMLGAVRSKSDARTDYSLLRGSLTHTQPLPPWFELSAEVKGQLADGPLPSLEEMSLGELTIGRGFVPGSITGDSGIGYKLELRFTPPSVEASWLNDFEVYGFYDYARVYDRGNPTGAVDGFEDLASVGFGTRFQLFDTLFGDFYVATPLEKGLTSSTRRPNSTVNFTLTKFF